MKKEPVSVLKPRNSKKIENKVKKVFKAKNVKLGKKNVENGIPSTQPRATQLHISNVEAVNINYNLKRTKSSQPESIVKTKKTHSPTKVKSVKTKNAKNDASVDVKMATVRKDPENKTRGRPKKKPKIPVIDPPSVAIERKKRVKPEIEAAEETKRPKMCVTKKVKSDISKKVKSDISREVNSGISKKVKSNIAKKVKSDIPKKVKSDISNEVNSDISKKVKSDISKEVNSVISKKLKTRTSRKKNIENSGHLKLSKEHILRSIKAIKKLASKKLDSKKFLLPTEDQPVYLQVTCVKIPKTPRRHIRPYLPHPLVGPLDDVAIFVPDLELGRKKDYEKTVEHWETLFREKGIDCIKQIIPMNQIKTEYSQFEMKRKLAMSFEYFLADSRICGHLTHLLGKGFYKRRDAPIPVKLTRDNLKDELNFALHKTCLEIHSFGNSHTVQAGTVSMKSEKLAENVRAICETLEKEYPGGWPNVRAIQIKTRNSFSIPIYLTLSSKNEVNVPNVKPRRPRAYETVEGELTTLPGKATVTVTPEGKVKLKRTRDSEDEEDNDEIKEEDEEEDEDEEKNKEDDE